MIIMLISIEAQREGYDFYVIIMLTNSDHHERPTVLISSSQYSQYVCSQKPAAAQL